MFGQSTGVADSTVYNGPLATTEELYKCIFDDTKSLQGEGVTIKRYEKNYYMYKKKVLIDDLRLRETQQNQRHA